MTRSEPVQRVGAPACQVNIDLYIDVFFGLVCLILRFFLPRFFCKRIRIF